MTRFLAAVVAATLAIGGSAQAQARFDTFQPNGLPTVFVTERSGRETTGKLVTITESALTIQVDGTMKTFAVENVSLVERKGDSLKNGTIAGLIAGIGLGILSLGMADCPDSKDSCAGFKAVGILASTGIYAAVGAGIDAAVSGRTRVWPAKPGKSGLVTSASAKDRRLFVGWRVSR